MVRQIVANTSKGTTVLNQLSPEVMACVTSNLRGKHIVKLLFTGDVLLTKLLRRHGSVTSLEAEIKLSEEGELFFSPLLYGFPTLFQF
jgi:hypothetical protein